MSVISNSGEKIRIEGVIIQPLRQITDDHGVVLHMLRKDSSIFRGFGEVYFSEVRRGIVKAWKRHQRMTQHFAVPVGKIRLVIYDDRSNSSTEGTIAEILLGRPDAYHLVRIPPKLWYGFQGQGREPIIIANCTDIPHDPDEIERLDINSERIPYRWPV